MSGAEVAECLGIAEETVKTRLFRARRRLQEMLVQSIEPSLPSIYEFHLSRCDRVVAAVLHRIGDARTAPSAAADRNPPTKSRADAYRCGGPGAAAFAWAHADLPTPSSRTENPRGTPATVQTRPSALISCGPEKALVD